MKNKFKSTLIAILLTLGLHAVSMVVYGIAPTAPTLEPDAFAYNAIKNLGFSETTPATLPTSITAANAQSYLDALTAAETFFDGTTYKTNITAWKNAVDAFKKQADAVAVALGAAKTALTAAKTQTTPTELNTSIGNMAQQFSALKADANNAADISSFYTNISNAYKNLSTQSSATVATYLDNLKTLSGTITTNSTMFEGQDIIKGSATAVTANAEAAKGITTLLGATMATPQEIGTVLTNTKAAASAWRTIKNAIPQQ